MSVICLIDTSVFLNLLQVPGRSNDVQTVMAQFQEYIALGCTFILPMATVLETGNHIAQNGNGHARRQTAERFVDAVNNAFSGDAPWSTSEFPSCAEVSTWLAKFPEVAGRNKAPAKISEGTSFGDLSIIEEYEKSLRRFAMSEIFIWSLDTDLAQYHHVPPG